MMTTFRRVFSNIVDGSKGLSYLQISIFLLISAVVTFQDRISKVMCQRWSASSVTGFEHDTWCFEFYLNRYQTLISALAAVGAGWAAWSSTQASIREAKNGIRLSKQQLAVAALGPITQQRNLTSSLSEMMFLLSMSLVDFDPEKLTRELSIIVNNQSNKTIEFETHNTKIRLFCQDATDLCVSLFDENAKIASDVADYIHSQPLATSLYSVTVDRLKEADQIRSEIRELIIAIDDIRNSNDVGVNFGYKCGKVSKYVSNIWQHINEFSLSKSEFDVLAEQETDRLNRLIDHSLATIYNEVDK